MEIKEVLRKNNFSFNKRFGQNFITDDTILSDIVKCAGVNENSTVMEIGCGAGTLTTKLAESVKKVYGFEIDNNLKPVLSETLSHFGNVEIIFKDVLKIPTEELENIIQDKYSVVANLPYYITTPIIMKFINEAKNVESLVVMVQKEVALRLVAKNDTADYGAITVAIDSIADASIVKYVDRTKFYPSPKVDSAVVKIDINKNKYNIENKKIFRDVVRSGFTSRRKTFVNNLITSFKLNRVEAENLLKSCGIDVSVRAEQLSTEQFIQVSKELQNILK